MTEASKQDYSLQRTFELLRTNSYIARDSLRPRPKPNPTIPTTTPTPPTIISMEDIKPTRQHVPITILKRPTIVQSEPSKPVEPVHKPNEVVVKQTTTTTTTPPKQAELLTLNSTEYTPTTSSNKSSPEMTRSHHTDPSPYIMQSDSTSPISRRNRKHTLDSMGVVKIAPAEGKFDDIKSEAVNFWDSGFDLKLDTNTKGKKKAAEWQNDFCTDTASTPVWQPTTTQAWQPEVTTTTTTASSETTSNISSYADVVMDKKSTPSWALDQPVVEQPTYHYPTQQQQQQQAWTPSHVLPMMPYVPMQPTIFPQSKYDTDLFYMLYKVIRDGHVHTIQKKLNSILARHLHEILPRTFHMLLEVLVILLNDESSKKETETARRIRESWQFFSFYLTRHVQTYAKSPEDLLTILSLLTALQNYSRNIQKELPIPDIVRLYDTVKDLCTADIRKECVYHLRLLKAIPEDKDSSWRDLDEKLPLVPTAELIVTEAINNLNILKDYEAKKEIHIVNKIHNPWPNVDLLNYSLAHFMMLRDEFSGPIQHTIKSLYLEKSTTQDIELPVGCAIFEFTIPRGTTLLLSSSEPAIVFELGPPLAHDKIMESFSEGSLVLLLPESSTTISPTDHHTTMTTMAKGSMMGSAVRASSSSRPNDSRRLVTIHINKQELSRLDWSTTYTIITCSTNAASHLSVLQWLYKQYMGVKKETFSSILTPRILAANNILSNAQLIAWDEENTENAAAINQDAVPDYLANVEIDIACILAVKNTQFKAKPGDMNWPRHSSQWENVAMSKRPPLYSISSSQIAAVQYAMCHRIAVIAGAPGTGKTFIAGKLAQLMTEALTVGQYHQPVLILTKSQSALDSILTSIVGSISDIVRFGPQPWDEVLLSKQATRLAAPNASDANYRQHQSLERQLCKNQIKLNALMFARFQAAQHDPDVLCTAIAPPYLKHLQAGLKSPHAYTPSNLSIWNVWAGQDKKTKEYQRSLEEFKAMDHAQWNLESTYLKRAGLGLMPMVDPSLIQSRFTWIANNSMGVLPITDCTHWPFEDSIKTGTELRTALLNCWKRVPAEKIWSISSNEKTKVIESLSKVLVQYLEYEIQHVLQDQVKTAKAIDDHLVQKWSYLCRFNRVVGMTSHFAATHREWVSTLWPRAIIVDEASEILESTLSSTVLGPRTEHIVLLGNNDVKPKPVLVNQELSGNPRNLDVSMFERWKGSGSKFVLLEEQWRMHSQVADIVDKFNSTKHDQSSLLTAPIATCNENMVDGCTPQMEKMYGINQRAFYLNYQPGHNTIKSQRYSRVLKVDLTEAEVDEARFVAYFAVYLSQQPYPHADITILTTCLTQKYLIRSILRDEIPKQTCFISNVSKINLDTIEQNHGRQDGFTIISTATPASSFSTQDNVTRALTRGKYGVFIIGKPDIDDVHPRWKSFATYMEERELLSDKIQLTCDAHGDMFSVGYYKDFSQMKNGGCSRPCNTLMGDGHVCQEVCHFLSHDEIICQEPCNRMRPTFCPHTCIKKCFECSKNGACPPCEQETTITLDCGHSVTDICHKVQQKESIQCTIPVQVDLSCGHTLTTQCCFAKDTKKLTCKEETTVTLECGHKATTKCGVEPMCTDICSQTYECGHKCQEMCGIHHTHEREKCPASCPKQLICGHGCDNGCAHPDKHTEFCIENCNHICNHGYKCSRECWRECIKCLSLCSYKCSHYKCTKKCFEICDRPPCNRPCPLNLSCSHRCSGLCGEPCPPCTTCNGDLKCSISLRSLSEFDQDEKVYVLPECGCVFSVESLDMYFQNQAKNGEHTAVKLWGCPTCQKTIYRAFRYNKYIKTEINLVNTIKAQLENERQKLSHHEKTQIINAMNDETRLGIHNMVGGRWFVCQNQHPYFVGDCGGATQISKCPECDAPIGGTQHKVVESNRFYGEFDGSEEPAWPGQPLQK